MTNVTITLQNELAQWARVEAARNGKSLSKFLADILRERRAPSQKVSATLEEFLSGPGWPEVAQNLPKRDELYDRPALLRHEHPGLRAGPDGTEEKREGG